MEDYCEQCLRRAKVHRLYVVCYLMYKRNSILSVRARGPRAHRARTQRVFRLRNTGVRVGTAGGDGLTARADTDRRSRALFSPRDMLDRAKSCLLSLIPFRHHIIIVIAHTQCLESSRNIHRIVANIEEHSQHCIDIHVDKTKRAGGSPDVSCCLSYVASTGNCTM